MGAMGARQPGISHPEGKSWAAGNETSTEEAAVEDEDGALPVPAHTKPANPTTNVGFNNWAPSWWEDHFKVHSPKGKDAHGAVNKGGGYRGGADIRNSVCAESRQ